MIAQPLPLKLGRAPGEIPAVFMLTLSETVVSPSGVETVLSSIPSPVTLTDSVRPSSALMSDLKIRKNAIPSAPITIQPPDLMRLAMYPKWRVRNVAVKDGRFEVAALSHGSYEVRILDLVLATFKMGTESVTLDLKLPE